MYLLFKPVLMDVVWVCVVDRYYEFVGESKCTIVDTWWQTETGGHMASPLPGVTPMKPGAFLKMLFVP